MFTQCKKAFKGIIQQIAAEEICELAKSKIGFRQLVVHKILKRNKLFINTLTRNTIKL